MKKIKPIASSFLYLFTLLCMLAGSFPPAAEASFLRGGGVGPIPPHALTVPAGSSFLYSTLKAAGWGGASIRIQRASDSTQTDIGFGSNNYINMTTATVFCAGTTCNVVTFYDESGNGLDAVCTTSCPILRAANSVLGIQPITFMSTNGAVGNAFLAIPNTMTLSRQSYTVAVALSVGGGLFNSASPVGLGTSATASNNSTFLYDNTGGGQVRWFDSTFHGTGLFPQVGQASVQILRSDASNAKMRVNGVEISASASTATTLTGGQIGQGSWSGAPFAASEIFAVVGYPTSLSSGNSAAIETEFASVFNAILTPTTTQMTYDGDSITAGYNAAGYLLNLPRQTNPLLTHRIGTYDMAVAGQTMEQRYTNRANALLHIRPAVTNIDEIFAGTNDIANRPSGTIVGYGTTVFNNFLIPYVQAMQAGGFDQIIVGTMLPRLWTGSATDISQRETERLDYNSLIIANAATYGYVVADYASLYTSDPTAYTTGGGSVDGIHPTVATYGNMAVVLAAVLNPLLAANDNFSNSLFAENDNFPIVYKRTARQ